MNTKNHNHLISFEMAAFIIDRRARNRSPRTIEFYEDELANLRKFLAQNNIHDMEDIQTIHLRLFIIDISQHRNVGGTHAAYRAMKAFLFWFADEIEDEHYRRLIKKVVVPLPSSEPLPGIPIDHVNAMLDTCERKTLAGQRDRSIIVTLIDTGVRRNELIELSIADVNMKTGAVHVYGKGDKKRIVFMGNRARRELIRYLRFRSALPPQAPLYATLETNERLTPDALRDIIRRRARAAHVPEPGLHDFRRTFAIECLRNGMDVVTLMRLMGHTTTTVLLRYLRLIDHDLQTGHQRSSPIDNL